MSTLNTQKNDVEQICNPNLETCPLSREIKALRQEIEILREQANVDALTKLYNRRYFSQCISQESERTKRTGLATSLVLLDIDFFKKINDGYGHKFGDQVLQEVAETIQKNCRKIDIPCRYGGEEFAIVLPSTSLPIAVQVANRLREKIASLVIVHQEENTQQTSKKVKVTASFGLASMEHQTQCNVDKLVELADKYLYDAKKSGRNCVKYPDTSSMQKTMISQDERNALFD